MNKPTKELSRMYCSMVMQLIQNGERVSPRGKASRELTGGAITIPDPHDNVIQIPERKLNYHFMVAEAFWMMLGREDVSMIRHYNKNLEQFSDDGVKFAGAYGPRIMAQLPRIIDTLMRDPMSRQAVISIWDRMPTKGSKDVPCTVSMQFFLRGDPPRLRMIVYMRSSDIWWGLPYDIFNFTMIQNALAAELNEKLGTFSLFIGSSHIYEEHVNAAMRMCVDTHESRWGEYLTPDLPGWPLDSFNTSELLARNGSFVASDHARTWDQYLEILSHRASKRDDLLVGNAFGEMMLKMKESRHAT